MGCVQKSSPARISVLERSTVVQNTAEIVVSVLPLQCLRYFLHLPIKTSEPLLKSMVTRCLFDVLDVFMLLCSI